VLFAFPPLVPNTPEWAASRYFVFGITPLYVRDLLFGSPDRLEAEGVCLAALANPHSRFLNVVIALREECRVC
jgi:hypothetical protein